MIFNGERGTLLAESHIFAVQNIFILRFRLFFVLQAIKPHSNKGFEGAEKTQVHSSANAFAFEVKRKYVLEKTLRRFSPNASAFFQLPKNTL